MPELPDIEVTRQRVTEHALKRDIASVTLTDPKALRGSSSDDLSAALVGYHLETVHRRGKVLFLKISSGWHLAVHFGMTGDLVLHTSADDAPGHTRLDIAFSDSSRLAYDDMRKLGWVELTDSPDVYLRTLDLGPDALDISREALGQLIADKGGGIKAALMDQSQIAGIGNVYADEILFQAGVDPRRKTKDLKAVEIDRLHESIEQVLRHAVSIGAVPNQMPGNWLTPHRTEGANCPRCGRALTSVKVSGRTAYLCSHCQNGNAD